MPRITTFFLTTLPIALASQLLLPACSSENEPASSQDIDGDSDSTNAVTSNSTVTSTSTVSTTSSSTGTATTGSGGTSSTTGASTTTSTGTLGDPPCDLSTTAAGDEIKKGAACTASDVQLCYRTCGPGSSGWKTEECVAGFYAEGDCAFPADGDYSCYKIPDVIDAAVCPTETPQATMACDVPECTLCNLDNQYLDSGGAVKTGYCVCNPPNADGERVWTCASDTAWPCPAGNGC